MCWAIDSVSQIWYTISDFEFKKNTAIYNESINN